MIRTRLAPSPTGFLHVGGLRTALYCYLLARKSNGVFYLRIEDTDRKRYVEGAVENLVRSLHLCHLDPDEGYVYQDGKVVEKGEFGPYMQSKRLDIYKEHADILLKKEKAYRCFCTTERLQEMRDEQVVKKQAPRYDRRCMSLSKEEVDQKLQDGLSSVIRQKIPHDRILKVQDLVRGEVTFDCSTLDDHVLMKSDGFPTYHLAHVVDDHLMETNPVIRGEEWLPSLPKHVLLFEDFGWDIPEYAHLPLLLNENKSKLSKRDADVALEDYLKKGYLPEAMLNFVAFLGWNPGTEEEIFSLDELVERFSLDRVNKAGAVFSVEKLNWFNSYYIKQLSPEILLEKVMPFLREAGIPIESAEKEFVMQVVKVLQDRIKFLAEAPEYCRFFFQLTDYDKELLFHQKMKVTYDVAHVALTEIKALLTGMDDFSEENLKEKLIALVQKLGLKNGQVLWPMRAALTGEQFSPGAFEMAAILGKEETVRRIEVAIEKLT